MLLITDTAFKASGCKDLRHPLYKAYKINNAKLTYINVISVK